MVRPRKCRKIGFKANATYYKPSGIPIKTLTEIRISREEMEAIRLKDVEGLEQEDASKKMNTSQPTFCRILTEARKKISNALVHGKALRIED